MLLEFKTKNYKSFKDELVFSMMPAPKQKGLDYSILTQKIGSKTYKALSSAVIYGANASGKTNIIGAMETFKSIILRGNIRNSVKPDFNIASNILELIPNSQTPTPLPVDFSISFIVENLLVTYSVSINLGTFLEDNFTREILNEQLTINNNMIFNRGTNLEFGTLNTIKKYWINGFKNNENSAISLAKNNLNKEELFLTNGFRNMFSSKLVDIITKWLEKDFVVIYRADTIDTVPTPLDKEKKAIYIDETINEAANLFGINSNLLGYATTDDERGTKLFSIFNDKTDNLLAEIFESFGTIRFINIFPLILNVFLSGGTLVIDEFDASIHPMAIMSIINVFHNDEINKKNAQLIFNTHNPVFLNSNLLRRDEIKFVERNDETHDSIHYSLSDFGTSGDKGVRKHEDYMHKYFINQYGAIKDIDLAPIFERLLSEDREVE